MAGFIVLSQPGIKHAPTQGVRLAYWDFRSGALPNWLTLARAGAAYYQSATGLLAQAATDVARFDYVGGAPLGLLLEDASTNSALQSNTFSNASWTKEGANLAQNAIGPDGVTNSAWTFTATDPAASDVYQPIALAAGSCYTAYIKAGTATIAVMITNDATGNRRTYFDLSMGSVLTVNQPASAPSVVQAALTPVSFANGWWKLGVKNTGGSTTYMTIGLCDANESRAITVGKTALFYQADAHAGTVESSSIPTTSAAATRAADALSLAAGYAGNPIIVETQSEATDAVSRTLYNPGSGISALADVWLRKIGVYRIGTPTSVLNAIVAGGAW